MISAHLNVRRRRLEIRKARHSAWIPDACRISRIDRTAFRLPEESLSRGKESTSAICYARFGLNIWLAGLLVRNLVISLFAARFCELYLPAGITFGLEDRAFLNYQCARLDTANEG